MIGGSSLERHWGQRCRLLQSIIKPVFGVRFIVRFPVKGEAGWYSLAPTCEKSVVDRKCTKIMKMKRDLCCAGDRRCEVGERERKGEREAVPLCVGRYRADPVMRHTGLGVEQIDP